MSTGRRSEIYVILPYAKRPNTHAQELSVEDYSAIFPIKKRYVAYYTTPHLYFKLSVINTIIPAQLVYLTSSDSPVISAGFSSPMISSMVGARSASLPSRSFMPPSPIPINGTTLVV